MDVPRWSRPRGSAASDRGRADRSVAASELSRVPADPEQRPLPRGQEEDVEDLRDGLIAVLLVREDLPAGTQGRLRSSGYPRAGEVRAAPLAKPAAPPCCSRLRSRRQD